MKLERTTRKNLLASEVLKISCKHLTIVKERDAVRTTCSQVELLYAWIDRKLNGQES